MIKNIGIVCFFFALVGCSQVEVEFDESVIEDNVIEEKISYEPQENESQSFSTIISLSEMRELDIDLKDSEVEYVVLDSENTQIVTDSIQKSGQTLTIKKSGNYEFSGVLNDGRIIIDTDDDKNVQLILNGVEISNSTGSAIYVKNTSQAIITLATNSQNVLSDSDNYDDVGEDEPNATLFSTEDLVISGEGSLEVIGNYNDGITSKDNLYIEGGNIIVAAQDDGIRGKDSLVIYNGEIEVISEGDAIISDDNEKGEIQIYDGNFKISAGDDAIHANTVTISGGNIDILSSYEGIEGKTILVDGGNIQIRASDDGFNAAGGDESIPGEYLLMINGGDIYINSGGDSIDSNADVTMTGGNVIVHGTVQGGSSLDYDGNFLISGGTLIASGNGGMAKAPSRGSEQNSLFINFDESNLAGSTFSIQDAQNNKILEFKSENIFEYIIISDGRIESGNTYSYFIDDDRIAEIKIEDGVTIIGEIQSGRGR